jgi:predicted lipoprotein
MRCERGVTTPSSNRHAALPNASAMWSTLESRAMKRRAFIGGMSALVAGALGQGCKRAPDRAEVLHALVQDVVTPQAREMQERSRELESATRALAEAPTAERMRNARLAWKDAALAWKRASAFPNGPLVDDGALAQACYFPARSSAIDALVVDERTLSPAQVQELGADVKGLFGLEWLLFDRKGVVSAPAPTRVSGPTGDRARHLALVLAGDVTRLGGEVVRGLGDGGERYAKTFAQGGQASLDRLVNQMVETSETLVEKRLSLILWMDQVKRLQPSDVEGYSSGTSHELSLALVQALHGLYRGGLVTLAEAAAPAIAESVGRAFVSAERSLRELRAPLEDVVRAERARLEAVLKATKSLEVALKAELASALGVTLTFSSLDGD